MVASDRTCPRCGKVFSLPCRLAAHCARKTPCAPILEREDLPGAALEDPDLEKKKCRFCGRVFSSYTAMRRHVRESCKIAPNDKNGDAGMERLYEYTARRQQAQIEALQSLVREQSAQIGQLLAARGAPAAGGPVVSARGDGNRILQDNRRVTINVHGQESVAHLTEAKVKTLLDDALRMPELPQAASQAVLKAAMLVYSDPEHPENLTAYLPNKKGDKALVHVARGGTSGWEVQPTTLVLPPMARKSVDALFTKQPYEDAADYSPLLKELAENETRYTAGGELRPILVRNKALLLRALGALPLAGQPGGKS